MSDTVSCCTPCPTPQTVNIPGIEGPDGTAGTNGTNGTNGINAFTITTADFVLPAVLSNVTVSVLDATWMAIGQKVVVDGPATFQVVSRGLASCVLKFLGYIGDLPVGTNIVTGSNLSPAGIQGSFLPTISSYATGGVQNIPTVDGQVLTMSVVLPTAGHYLLMATVNIRRTGCTFNTTKSITLHLQETVNGPATLTNSTIQMESGAPTTVTDTWMVIPFPTLDYTATAGDTIQMFGVIAANPDAGSIRFQEGSIIAIPIF